MQDIRRLMVLVYSAATSDIWESVAINDFLEALDDSELSLEVRKRGPTTLEVAYRESLVLEGYMRAANKGKVKRPEQIHATATSAAENKELKRALEEVRKQLGQQEAKHRQLMEEQSQQLQQLFRNQLEGCTNINQPQGLANRSGPEQGRLPHYGSCYKCGQPGHGYRYCPIGYAPQQQPEAENRAPPHANHYVSGSRLAYLPARIYGKDRWCLLDSGSEVSVMPARCVPHDKLRPASQTVRAANGTDIPVIGETELSLETGGGVLTTPCLVSELSLIHI